jgi:hypothetical protein
MLGLPAIASATRRSSCGSAYGFHHSCDGHGEGCFAADDSALPASSLAGSSTLELGATPMGSRAHPFSASAGTNKAKQKNFNVLVIVCFPWGLQSGFQYIMKMAIRAMQNRTGIVGKIRTDICCNNSCHNK